MNKKPIKTLDQVISDADKESKKNEADKFWIALFALVGVGLIIGFVL